MRRFFCDNITDRTAVLAGDDAHHIARVLRMRAGERLSVCDGSGNEFDAVIASVSPEAVVCSLGGMRASNAESSCRITLFQCLPKAGKLEIIVQKCTELGVFAIVPTLSARCVVAPEEKDFERKRVRYQRVALEAAKQSHRAIVPVVRPLERLECVDPRMFDLFLIAYEEENCSLKSALRAAGQPGTIGMCIGPEGGFERGEVARITARGGVSVSLGKRILRAETAGMAMLAQVLYEVET